MASVRVEMSVKPKRFTMSLLEAVVGDESWRLFIKYIEISYIFVLSKPTL